MFYDHKSFPTDTFINLEPTNPLIDVLYAVQKRRSTDGGALKL